MVKGEDLLKTKYYIIGNPKVRAKIRYGLRLAGMSIVLCFACIGLGAVLRMVAQILAW